MTKESQEVPKDNANIIERVRHQHGNCESTEDFLVFWNLYPQAPLHLHLRNFNTIKGRADSCRYGPGRSNITISLPIPGLRTDGEERFWLDAPELDKILPSSTFNKLAELETGPSGGGVYFGDIVSLGPLIAKETGRTSTFTRQFGSGDPDMAEYEDFGPFYPQEEFESLNQETLKDQLESSEHMNNYGFLSLEGIKKMFGDPTEENKKD